MNDVVSHEAARFIRVGHYLPESKVIFYLGSAGTHLPEDKLRFLCREMGLLLGQISMSDKAMMVQEAFEKADEDVGLN